MYLINLETEKETHDAYDEAVDATHLIVSSADDSWGIGEIISIPIEDLIELSEDTDDMGSSIKVIFSTTEEDFTVPIYCFQFFKLQPLDN